MQEAQQAIERAQAALAEAEDSLASARHAFAGAQRAAVTLPAAAVGASLASAQAVIDAATAAQRAETIAGYLAEVVRLRRDALASAEAAWREAKAAAWAPVLHRGADLRIEAGARCDRAKMRLLGSGAAMPAQLREAESAMEGAFAKARTLFDAGTEIINRAVAEGAQLPAGAGWVPQDWPAPRSASGSTGAGHRQGGHARCRLKRPCASWPRPRTAATKNTARVRRRGRGP